MANIRPKRITLDEFHTPTYCEDCDGVLVYKGLGEYQCEDCEKVIYDDYGKVRNYLEDHRGANVAEISDVTGVSHKSIREMIKEKRFEVIDNRGGYIRCERCGENIKTGRYCPKCEMEYHRELEAEARASRQSSFNSGSAKMEETAKGSKRFTRDK